MSLWAEIRHMHLADGVPKKEIARRLHLDIKTVRRALACSIRGEKRSSPRRGARLDAFRGEIEALLRREPAITACRIGRLFAERTSAIGDRSVRRYVARLRRELHRPAAFVHRTHVPGETIEGDFGESWAVIAGRLRKVKFFVGVLPCSNAYFSKSYPFERLECLLDGMEKSMRYFGGVPRRFVLDNTSLAVKAVLAGRERRETDAFLAFRGAYALHVDFCAPAKGWEKGSVEGGVGFVRDNAFRPIPEVESFEELDARVLTELEASLDRRKHADGRSVRDALAAERPELRAFPPAPPQACRTLAVLADKFAHVRVDGVQYSLPVEHAHRPAIVKLFHDRLEVVVDAAVVARHRRSLQAGSVVIDPLHVLSLLEHKHRAVPESTAIQQWKLPEVFHELRARLRALTRKPDQEWVRVLRLLEHEALERVQSAVEDSIDRGSPRLETIQALLRRESAGVAQRWPPAAVSLDYAAALAIEPPVLSAYDELVEAAR